MAKPAGFSPYTTDEATEAEDLLEVAAIACEAPTGEEWEHVEPHDYETGSNEEGWQ
ncbi:hypothetical protein [Streptomyces sp. NPDC085466]|uniref:hypothetical protein n=1 Tax=Streptomyces sp. NPDC085466 TaxID=3365725 RepID=UPI0037D08DD1